MILTRWVGASGVLIEQLKFFTGEQSLKFIELYLCFCTGLVCKSGCGIFSSHQSLICKQINIEFDPCRTEFLARGLLNGRQAFFAIRIGSLICKQINTESKMLASILCVANFSQL